MQGSYRYMQVLYVLNTFCEFFGVQKNFIDKGMNIDLTFFNHKYENTIEGWKSAGWTPVNRPGVVRTRGLELLSKYKPIKDLNFNLGYTYNSTYDGADFDDPDLGPGSAGDFLNSQMVRVPRHFINIGANYNITVEDGNLEISHN